MGKASSSYVRGIQVIKLMEEIREKINPSVKEEGERVRTLKNMSEHQAKQRQIEN